MRPTLASLQLAVFIGVILSYAPAIGRVAADSELDQFEERAIARGVERGYRLTRIDRTMWLRELEIAFPKRVVDATTEDDYATWFVLLAGKAEEWKRTTAPTPQIGELYDRIVMRLELGPVPSIKRDEFMKYAKKVLIPSNPQPGMPMPDPNEEADKTFRVLDRDGDGALGKDELTTKLQADRMVADVDRNGQIDKTEYRAHFQRRVTVGVEAILAAKAAEKNGRGPDGKPLGAPGKTGTVMPEWFSALDIDKDGQIALHEWRKGGRAIVTFMEMDLDGDGLLTRDEYLRFVKMNEKAPEVPVPPPGNKVKM